MKNENCENTCVQITTQNSMVTAHCPVCGNKATGTDKNICEHLVFHYLHEIGEITHLAPYVDDEVREKIENYEVKIDYINEIIDLLDSESRFVLRNTSSFPKGSGHISYVMFDFDPPTKGDEK